MIGSMLGEVNTTTAPFGAGGSTSSHPVPVTSGVSLAPRTWSDMNESFGETIASRIATSPTIATGAPVVRARAAAAPALVQGPSFLPEAEGIPRGVVIAGAAVVGLALVGAIVYKLRK